MEAPTTAEIQPRGGALWRRQVGAMLGLELRKTFLRARALPVVAVAFLPALLLAGRVLAVRLQNEVGMPAAQVATIYAQIHQLFFSINQKHKTTIVIVTHNTALAERMPRVVTLRDGRVEKDERKTVATFRESAPVE